MKLSTSQQKDFIAQFVSQQFPKIISLISTKRLKDWVFFWVMCAAPLSSQSLQFQTIGGLSHHHQLRVGGRCLKSARLVLISSGMGVCLRIIVIVTVKADGPNMFASSHLIGVVSVQIHAATEHTFKFEQSKCENEKRLEALFP